MMVNVNYVIIVRGENNMNEQVVKSILSLSEGFLLEMYKFCNEMYFDSYVNGNEIHIENYKELIERIDQELRDREIWK